MGKKSEVWKHLSEPRAEENGQKTTCKWCKASLAYHGGTANLLNHLKVQHHHVTSTPAAEIASTSNSGTCTRPKKQARLDFHPGMTAARQEKITELVTNFISGDMKPISVIEGENFCNLLEYLEPEYQMPSRRTIGRRIEEKFLHEKNTLREKLVSASNIAITFDAWTNINMQSFLGVTGHYIDSTFNLHCSVLGVRPLEERHTGENIACWVEEILSNFDISPSIVVGAVSDNGSNMKACKRLLEEKFAWYNIGCSAHSLQLCLNQGFQLHSIQQSLAAARRLVQHFKRSELATSALKKKCEDMEVTFKKLAIDVSTRWNSTYIMIDRLIEMQWPIISVLSDPGIVKSSTAKTLALKHSDWEIVNHLAALLKPFVEVTNSLGAQKHVTISAINPYIKGLKKHISQQAPNETATVRRFREKVAEELTTRFKEDIFHVTWKATTLDPRFKTRGLTAAETTQLTNSLEADLADAVDCASFDTICPDSPSGSTLQQPDTDTERANARLGKSTGSAQTQFGRSEMRHFDHLSELCEHFLQIFIVGMIVSIGTGTVVVSY